MKIIYPLLLVTTISTAILTKPAITSGEFNIEGLNKQVQQQAQVLDNHETRIENLEADVQTIYIETKIPVAEHKEIPTAQPVYQEPSLPEPSPEPPVCLPSPCSQTPSRP